MIHRISDASVMFWDRIPKAYSNHQFAANTRFASDRLDSMSKIPPAVVFYEPTQVPRETTWTNQSKYAFVISPHGNGLDCHRTWEALCLGCIPIVKTSPIDYLYDRLPVWIVGSWTEVNRENMDKTVQRMRQQHQTGEFQYERLTMAYWMKIIRSGKHT